QIVGSHQSQAFDVALQNNGQIVVVGAYDIDFGVNKFTGGVVTGTSQGYVYRYNINGSADKSLQALTHLSGIGEIPGAINSDGYSASFQRVFVAPDMANPYIYAIGEEQRYNSGGLEASAVGVIVYRFLGSTLDSTY